MSSSNFRRRNLNKPIPGTRMNEMSGTIITSSGNPSMDTLLGGGLPLGSMCLIEEDQYVTHSKVLAKYFMAEGILSQHFVFLGSLDDDPNELLRKLPKPLNEEETEKERAETAQEEATAPQNGLRIAWRYDDLPLVNSEQSGAKIGHHFNLFEHMDPLLLEFAETGIWSENTPQSSLMDDDSTEYAGEDSPPKPKSPPPLQRDENSPETSATAGSDGDSGPAASEQSKDDIEMENVRNCVDSADSADSSGDTCEAMDLDLERPRVPVIVKIPLELSPLSTPSPPKPRIFANDKYLRLLNEIQPLLREDKFTTAPGGALGGHKGLCRLCITSLGSPLWFDDDFEKDILKFLTVLRASVRGSMAVCFVTMPMHLVAKFDEALVLKIRNLFDFSFELESFAATEREENPVFKNYSGLLHVQRMTAVNALSVNAPETKDLAFKLRRKKFVIEKLHLPPELATDSNEAAATASAEIVPTLGCGSSSGGGVDSNSKAKVSLDF